jgi:hypothetical protein
MTISWLIWGRGMDEKKNQHVWLPFDPLLRFATPPLQFLTTEEFDQPEALGGCFPPLREGSQNGMDRIANRKGRVFSDLR